MSKDYLDMLSAFLDAGVEFLLVGGQALGAHGYVRATLDMDLWVRRSPENAARIVKALRAYGAPMRGVGEQDFLSPTLILQIGVAPLRIDVLTAIEGVAFEEAWSRRITRKFNGLSAPVIGLKDLIQNKQAAGRVKDLMDVDALEKIERKIAPRANRKRPRDAAD